MLPVRGTMPWWLTDLLDIGAVGRVRVGQAVVLSVDGRERQAVYLRGAAVTAGPPFHLEQVLVALDL